MIILGFTIFTGIITVWILGKVYREDFLTRRKRSKSTSNETIPEQTKF